jgi:hypothetical protein
MSWATGSCGATSSDLQPGGEIGSGPRDPNLLIAGCCASDRIQVFQETVASSPKQQRGGLGGSLEADVQQTVDRADHVSDERVIAVAFGGESDGDARPPWHAGRP